MRKKNLEKVIIVFLIIAIAVTTFLLIRYFTNKNNYVEENKEGNTESANIDVNEIISSMPAPQDITVEQAQTMIEEMFGTHDETTGNSMTYVYITTIKDSNGKQYYYFRESWVIDDNHLSFLQNVFVSIDATLVYTNSETTSYEENQVIDFQK